MILLLFYMGILAALLSMFACSILYHRLFREEVEQNLADECRVLAHSYDNLDSVIGLQTFASETFRITLISENGTVLFESDAHVLEMQNHFNRPEIQQAFQSGEGKDTRYSDTIGTEDYYYALLLEDGNVLRVSVEANSIFALFEKSIFFLLVMFLVIIMISVIVSTRLTENLLSPIRKIPKLLQKQEFSQEKDEIYPELLPLINEIRYQRDKQEDMRQEFTANVSHELKTPLTSISGYAELIASGMATKEDAQEFAGKIHQESTRLLTLISDIIRLSELDMSGDVSMQDEINLHEIAEECRMQLSHTAQQRGIQISVSGRSEIFIGNRLEIYELVYHLTDNAVRYNRDNGNVDILISDRKLIVADTGIGIPEEHRTRIFERFYRVDKSRSRATGGTGLGLSIVRHVAEHHHAQITVNSTVHVGTEMIIVFENSHKL